MHIHCPDATHVSLIPLFLALELISGYTFLVYELSDSKLVHK